MIENAIEKQQAGLDLNAQPGKREQISAGIERGREQLNAGIERGREAATDLWATAKERPYAAAAIAGAVVATAAAATAGVVLLKRRRDGTDATDQSDEISIASRIPPAFGVAAE